jgi:hypothetical protein
MSSPIKAMPIERRSLKDRRQKPTRPISRYAFIGRRRETRRSDEMDNYYVDRYEWQLLVLISLILIFCILDAFLTYKISQMGGSEWNRLMASFMERNLTLSLAVKFLITAVCAVFLLVHKNFRIFGLIRTQVAIYIIFFVYFTLLLYEFSALFFLNWL